MTLNNITLTNTAIPTYAPTSSAVFSTASPYLMLPVDMYNNFTQAMLSVANAANTNLVCLENND